MKSLAAALVVALVLLQYRLWLSDDGVREVWRLQERGRRTSARRTPCSWSATRQLAAEVRGPEDRHGRALEERARSELGMIAAQRNLLSGRARRGARPTPADRAERAQPPRRR